MSKEYNRNLTVPSVRIELTRFVVMSNAPSHLAPKANNRIHFRLISSCVAMGRLELPTKRYQRFVITTFTTWPYFKL